MCRFSFYVLIVPIYPGIATPGTDENQNDCEYLLADVQASTMNLQVRCQKFVTFAFLAVLCGSCSAPVFEQLRGQTMGTYYSVQYRSGETCHMAQSEADEVLQQVNASMSTYQQDSELSQLNEHPGLTWLPLSSELAEVLQAASTVWLRSNGAFDVTVGPLVNLWGFGPQTRADMPTLEAQSQAAAKVGMDKLTLQGQRLLKSVPGLYIDLSALAKGYGVDQLASGLIQRGCTDFMVDIGGEIRVAGLNAEQKPWRIGIEVPDPSRLGTLQTVVSLSDVSIATSGDYRNFRMIDGERVDHVIDPRSGRPANNRVVSATVVHASAMWADAYATTLMVLGLEDGMAFAEREGVAVYMMLRKPLNIADQFDQESSDQESDGEELLEAHYNAAMRSFLPVAVE
jgi:thiamine biosynthesis lipoprotein